MNCFIKDTLKQLPRVLEVSFGVGAGAGQTLEGLVQNRNNPLLFFKRWERDGECLDMSWPHIPNGGSTRQQLKGFLKALRLEK